MKELAKWAPVGGAICLIVAAYIIGRNSRRDVKEIYTMIDHYDKIGK
jgi:hypothetical protein